MHEIFFLIFFHFYFGTAIYLSMFSILFFRGIFFLNFWNPFPFPTKNKFFRQITVVILFTKVVHNLKSSTATRLKWNEVVGTMLYLKCAILLPYLLMTMTRHNAEIKNTIHATFFLGIFLFYCSYLFFKKIIVGPDY